VGWVYEPRGGKGLTRGVFEKRAFLLLVFSWVRLFRGWVGGWVRY
jgi:hypothetical protein